MQTARVTFLTTPDQKAALDAFAAGSGMSVGHIVREATSQFIAQPTPNEEVELAALVEQVDEAIPKMHASLDSMSRTLQETHAKVDGMLRDMGAWA